MRQVTIQEAGELKPFRDAARALILDDVPPAEVVWADAEQAGLFGGGDAPSEAAGASPAGPAGGFSVPAGYMRLAEDIVCHRDPERYALLYELLWRITHGERELLRVAADPLVARLERMRKAIGREVHKMHAFVRFREVAGDDSGERFVAWFEPEHHILDRAAPFFTGRFPAMRWSILTPLGSLHWDTERLTHGPAVSRDAAPADDDLEGWWRTYYRSAFNPARANPEAMRAEMPKRYWRNLPEAALIPELLEGAGRRTETMLDSEPTAPKKTSRPYVVAATPAADTPLAELAAEAQACTRCDLYRHATQTVFGAGAPSARVMFVGEQPGDQEDLAGLPFVGPAGQLFDRALAEAGVERAETYVTNAVKHFKFEPRGKRRIHKKPDRPEIEACRWWLEKELATVRPALVVALGATAGQAIFGRTVRVMAERGAISRDPRGFSVLLTVHPSFLLRLPDEDAKAREYAAFVRDLRQAA